MIGFAEAAPFLSQLANVRWAEKQLASLPEGKQALEAKAVTFVGLSTT
jgi:hypothetical protein